MIYKLATVVALAVLSTQAIAMDEGALNSLDADGDTSISKEEFSAFSTFAFDAMDLDKNGSLSAAEVAAHADEAAFGRADTDENGTVSKDEFMQRMDANFEAADQDGDGLLN
ncbi:MAG: EF-hand domain-containing protein [Pseudomonadota bacterium]